MLKKKHREYHLSDLSEGNTRMVDPYVNPDKDNYSDEGELGINTDITHKGHRWQVDTFKGRMGPHKTPKLKDIIKECLVEVLNESMTFRPSGTNNDYDYSRLLDICFALGWVFNKEFGKFSEFEKENFNKSRVGELFSPDGGSKFDGPLGTINFYTAGLNREMIRKILLKINEFLKTKNLKFELKTDKSKMYNSGVYRIKITENPNSPDETPEATFSNVNACSVLKTLGYDDIAKDYHGKIDARELLFKVTEILQSGSKRIPQNTRQGRDPDRDKFLNKTGETKGPKVYDSGLSSEDILFRLFNLQGIAQWAIKHGNGKISVG